MPAQTPSTPTNTNKAGGVLNAAKPLPNNYEKSAQVSSDALKEQTSTLGHNTFRADIYKVSEGRVA
jgi:hypothetical protein